MQLDAWTGHILCTIWSPNDALCALISSGTSAHCYLIWTAQRTITRYREGKFNLLSLCGLHSWVHPCYLTVFRHAFHSADQQVQEGQEAVSFAQGTVGAGDHFKSHYYNLYYCRMYKTGSLLILSLLWRASKLNKQKKLKGKIIISILQVGNWALEKLCDSPKVICGVCGRTGYWPVRPNKVV